MTEDDRQIFRKAVADARPLTHDRVPLASPAPPPRPLQRLADERRVLEELIESIPDDPECATGEELLFLRPGVQNSVLRKLRRGHYSVGAQIDLHGMTAAEARPALAHFLQEARRRGARCVRVIHGKGLGSKYRQPVLKVKVNHWLRQRDEVLAFASAPATDGGTGAAYVLLKSL